MWRGPSLVAKNDIQNYVETMYNFCQILKRIEDQKRKFKNHALMAWGTRGWKRKGKGQEEAEENTWEK